MSLEQEDYESVLSSYENLCNDITSLIKDHLTLSTRSLILYGSYLSLYRGINTPYFIPGESDLDLLLIVDTRNEESTEGEILNATDYLKKFSEVLNPVIFEPTYASILDLNILDMSDFPIPSGSSFDYLYIDSASRGQLLVGKSNFLGQFPITQEQIKEAAISHVYRTWEDLKNNLLHRDMLRESELFWMAVDNVLDAAHAFCAFQGSRQLVRMEVVDYIVSQNWLDSTYSKTLQKINRFRYDGVTNFGGEEFLLESMLLLRHFFLVMKDSVQV